MGSRVATLIVCLLLVAVSGQARAQAEQARHELGVPELTVLISPAEPWLQQQIVQSIRLESALPFDALDVSLGTIEGAEVVELLRPTLREFESWGVRGHVYETSRAIFPRQSGALHIPAVRITGATRSPDDDVERFERLGTDVALRVRAPNAALGEATWLVADDVTLTEHWSTEPEAVTAGEIVTRTIRVRAQGVSGEHLPALNMATSLGVHVQAHEPKRRTEVTEDGLIGHLEQAFAVHIATEKTTDISGIHLPWLRGESGEPRFATVRAYRVEPIPADVQGMVERLLGEADARRADARRKIVWATGVVLGLALLLIALSRLPGRMGRSLKRGLRPLAHLLVGRRRELPDVGYHRFGETRIRD